MADYRMKADYRAMAPEVNPVQINPTIGIYQDGFGTDIARGARDIASISADYNSNISAQQQSALELESAKEMAGVFERDADLVIQHFAQTAAEGLGRPLTEDELFDLSNGIATDDMLRRAGYQNPRRARFQLQRIVNYKKDISRNPLLAPEINEALRVGGGINPIESVVQDIQSTDRFYEAAMTDLDTATRQYGIDPNRDPLERAELIRRFRELDTRKKISDAQYGMAQNKMNLDADLAVRTMRAVDVPYDMQQTQRQFQEILARAGGDPANIPVEVRRALLDEFDESHRGRKLAFSSKFSHPKLSDAAVNGAYAPADLAYSQMRDVLSGKKTADQAKQNVEMINQLSEQNFIAENPDWPMIQVGIEALESIPAGSVARMTADQILNDRIGPLFTTIGDRISERTRMRLLANGDPETVRDGLRNTREWAANLAKPEVPQDQYISSVRNIFAGYKSQGFEADRMDQWLTALSTPEHLARLEKVGDATLYADMARGATQYLSDLTAQSNEYIRNTMSEGYWSPQMLDPAQYGGGRFRLFGNTAPYIETTVHKNGTPVFSVATDAPAEARAEAQKAASALNRKAGNIRSIALIGQATGVIPDMPVAEAVGQILETGRIPTAQAGDR